jgi:hypothetical protein
MQFPELSNYISFDLCDARHAVKKGHDVLCLSVYDLSQAKELLKLHFKLDTFLSFLKKIRKFGAKIFGNVGSLSGNSIMVAKLKQ